MAEYDLLVSTLPLNRMLEMTGLRLKEDSDPYTSVLVLNIGAMRGPCCPDDHWIYVPRSKAGFHRVGFYSNVDASFLPRSCREARDRVSIYVEKAYPGGQRPSPEDIAACSQATVEELRQWGFISTAEAVDPTWIDVAYTWSRPGSKWREVALKTLEEHDVIMVGRYGRWVFQGIADSIRDGFFVGASARTPEGAHGHAPVQGCDSIS
jgi:protoporphyrinogen oxidase